MDNQLKPYRKLKCELCDKYFLIADENKTPTVNCPIPSCGEPTINSGKGYVMYVANGEVPPYPIAY